MRPVLIEKRCFLVLSVAEKNARSPQRAIEAREAAGSDERSDTVLGMTHIPLLCNLAWQTA